MRGEWLRRQLARSLRAGSRPSEPPITKARRFATPRPRADDQVSYLLLVVRSHSRRDPRSFRWESFDAAWRDAAQHCGLTAYDRGRATI